MTGFYAKAFLCFSAIMVILVFPPRLSSEMTKKRVNLPKTIGVWTRPDSAQLIDSGNIFEYMNGAGELYLAYGFGHLEVYEYTADQQDGILVEVYFMDTSDDAFGLLSLDWGGEPIELQSEPSIQSNNTVAPPVRALYGRGLLRIWADTIYARVMAYRETPESKKAVLSMGRTIAANRKMPAEPELLGILPKTMDSEWKLLRDRIGYFRSHLVLNSLYYLSHKNILHLDHSTEAVTAVYEHTVNAGTSKPVRILFVKYATPERAREALENFHDAYLHEHPKALDPAAGDRHMNAFKVEDGWLGYSLEGTCLAIAFECPNKKSAQMMTKQLSHNAARRQNSHGE